MADDDSEHNQFWNTLTNYHKITVPKHIQNIIKCVGLDKTYVSEEANEQYKNNKPNDMNFDFSKTEKFVRNEEYIAVANMNMKDATCYVCSSARKPS